jgi:hypothetical protein
MHTHKRGSRHSEYGPKLSVPEVLACSQHLSPSPPINYSKPHHTFSGDSIETSGPIKTWKNVCAIISIGAFRSKNIYIYISIEAFYIVELASFKSCQTVRKLQKKNAVVWGVVHTLGISSNS